MTASRLRIGIALAVTLAACRPSPVATAPSPSSLGAIERIRDEDLRRDIFALAGDAMRGRETGTLDELRAAAWVADRAREAGLEPAGEDGTYFQFFPVRRTRLSAGSRIAINGTAFDLWRDAVVVSPVDTTLDLAVTFVGDAGPQALESMNLTGKAVAAIITPPTVSAPAPGMSLRAARYTGVAIRERAAALTRRGAAAVILVGDSIVDASFDMNAASTLRGSYALDTGVVRRPRGQVPVIVLRRSALGLLRDPAARLTAMLSSEVFMAPSANVVARVRGTDPALREEYVLFSAHHDHNGVRTPVNGDSIYNGADDEATVSVALLAIARAWTARPARRSGLFIWHGAEERGLLGSRWYVEHPTVPRSSIAAVLNGDMIGRNHPDTAALLGVNPPHRNSRALVDAGYEANRLVGRFVIDTTWDAPTHIEGWYFRSDHLPYARAGVPAIFFTTLLHADYHTPMDEPGRIDIAKLGRMTRWMHATGWIVGNATERPAVDPGFKLER